MSDQNPTMRYRIAKELHYLHDPGWWQDFDEGDDGCYLSADRVLAVIGWNTANHIYYVDEGGTTFSVLLIPERRGV